MKVLVRVLVCIIVAAMIMMVCGCNGSNYQMHDYVRQFDEAEILMPDGEILRGKVQHWRDYEDGDQIQIQIDGVWYLTHFSNAVLIAYPGE